jgi:glycerol-3-phosphate acyltransferase PlsY
MTPGAATYALYLVPALVGGYLVGSIPFAYVIVKLKTGEDITAHGTGNVGSMNVRRTTGSWEWFVVALLADGLKGLVPVAFVKTAFFSTLPWLVVPNGDLFRIAGPASLAPLMAMAAVAGTVVGHNYSVWMALIEKRFARTGKGLATGAGALLAYDWRYLVAVVVVGLLVIALTRYMMAGQVAAAAALPVTALLLRSADWPFALVMGAVVYAAHHRRFVGMLRGREPRLYINDRMGPRG